MPEKMAQSIDITMRKLPKPWTFTRIFGCRDARFESTFGKFISLVLSDLFRLVAPQGFTGDENKEDIKVFHIYPHTIPHSQNKNSYPDSSCTLPHFLAPLRTLAKRSKQRSVGRDRGSPGALYRADGPRPPWFLFDKSDDRGMI